MNAAGFVLAGGQSRRMGRDKALLPWNSGFLVQDVARRVTVAAGNVAIIGEPLLYGNLGFHCIGDLRPGLGPLAGIETALASGRGQYNLVLACDMPDLPIQHLSELLRVAQAEANRCTVTLDSEGKVHPLCAVYSLGCLPQVGRALDDNRLRLLEVVEDLTPIFVVCSQPIRNVNTIEEWSSATV